MRPHGVYRFRRVDGPRWRSHTGSVLARVRSATLSGIEAATIFVEVDVTAGLPSFTIARLPDSAGRERCDRVRAAGRSELPDSFLGSKGGGSCRRSDPSAEPERNSWVKQRG